MKNSENEQKWTQLDDERNYEEALSKLTYEEALKKLEEVVQKLESGDTTLDESLKLFKLGTALSRFCAAKLASVEKQITELIQKEDGTWEERPFGNEV